MNMNNTMNSRVSDVHGDFMLRQEADSSEVFLLYSSTCNSICSSSECSSLEISSKSGIY